MLLFSVILLGALLLASLTANFLLYKAAERQMNKADYLEEYVSYAREHVLHVYAYIKSLDDRQIFAKDDEVGVVFQEMLDVLQKLNEVIQEEGE